MNIHIRLLCAPLALAALSAHALQITQLTPQGEVAQVHQVVAKFDQPAVNFGDPRAAAPLDLQCDDPQSTKGSARWISDREWAFQFDRDLPPGVRCTVTLRPGFRAPSGALLALSPAHATGYRFHTGGPFVQRVIPFPGQAIDEQQYFTLQLNGPATAQSIQANVWCSVQGLGERVPVRLLDAEPRAQLLKAQHLEKAATADPLRYVTLACNRRLTPSTKVQLVYGKGVATPGTGDAASGGVANVVEKRFDFQVHEPFYASFNCERENAQSACLPIRPVALEFNAPVARKLAETITLRAGSTGIKPSFDKTDGDSDVQRVVFKTVLPEQAQLVLELPMDFADVSGRPLSNASSFPLKVATGAMPPLAKFAASPFGVVERFAEPDSVPLMPVTLRKVEAELKVRGLQPGATTAAGRVSLLRPDSDAEIIAWYRKVQRYDAFTVSRKQAARDVQGPLPPVLGDADKTEVQSRMLSLLQGKAGVKTLELPRPLGTDPRPFEVVGIPLKPGFHVLEIASPVLGASLLDARLGSPRTMFVRSSALVTNLGVHFKLGRENALAWVTTLDKGLPVPNAKVRVSDCRGREVASASTDAQGLAYLSGVSPQAPRCGDGDEGEDGGLQAYFVSARADNAGAQDMAFTWSDWHRGIEPWRFNVPTSLDPQPDIRAHTILDRSLLHAGETVSMKHVLRSETGKGFARVASPPATLLITHVGSGQEFTQPLTWRTTPTGGQSAESSFQIPATARLGMYDITLRGAGKTPEDQRDFNSGQFRVEAFRLPVLQGRITPSDPKPLVNLQKVPVQVQVGFVSGGAAAKLPVQVSAMVRAKHLDFSDFDAFSFSPPRDRRESADQGEEDPAATQDQRVIADKLPVTLDKSGAGEVVIDKVPTSRQAQELLLEASYSDPNGEVQTIRSSSTLWPAGVVAGIKTEGWVSANQQIRFQALALDLSGKPLAGVPLEVQAISRIVTTSRKRMVGGFYTYDNKTEEKSLGTVCKGQSDARGLLLCDARLEQAGEVELVVTARDSAGNAAQAASSVYVTRQGELWFGGEDHDRMDVLPEKKSYEPGEVASFQVRMPFRFATALVAVEREGILGTRVVQINGQDPTVKLKIEPGWGPNVYVSVLALRGRLRDVPWYSFFTWGYKAPREWWTAFWYEGREYVAPSALVDLSKPAFRLGVAEIRVATQAHHLDVKLEADHATYRVRGQAVIRISAKLPDGKPAAHAEVAVAAVDQALLELMPNTSWDLLSAMLQRRSWGVETSTAQMEIVGRRHYGRKAVAAGGGGGHSATRELLDTLLLWNPRVLLDAQGQATVTVPLNDALTTFRIAAVADAGIGLFGTGQLSIRTTQDLQIISGLAPLVREGDAFRAQFTLRNSTKDAMKVALSARASLLAEPDAPAGAPQLGASASASEPPSPVAPLLKPQTVDIPAGEAREVIWDLVAPTQTGAARSSALVWEIEARDSASSARDALRLRQRIEPAVPLRVQQATLTQLDAPYALNVALPTDAVPGRGGLKLSLRPTLAAGLPGVRDWFANYPFTCLEQEASKAIGMHDAKLWQTLMALLPGYLDADGLAGYFPPRDGDADRGSDTLTAYLLAVAHEAASAHPEFALPEAPLASMQRGLIAFVEGRIQRSFWSPRKDLDVRKLAALEALSRYGKAQGRMLGSITIAPNQWPTSALIDWLSILRHVSDVPQREQRMAQANQILRARLDFQGTRLGFSTEQGDAWWWLMVNGDVNAARLMLAALDSPEWSADMGRLANGFIARQQHGAWSTTTANAWGSLALEKFSARFESAPVSGVTQAALGAARASVDWAQPGRDLFLPWPATPVKQTLNVNHLGTGKPWLTVQSLAAVDLKTAFNAGFQIVKTITPVEQAHPGVLTRGDVLRVTLQVTAASDMTWVVVSDPIPGGATILGSGLGRDSQIATAGQKQPARGANPAFEERSQEAFRSYYDYLPKGMVTVRYTLRLNNVGEFAVPPSRAEAMYAPEMFGEIPNARMRVEAPR